MLELEIIVVGNGIIRQTHETDYVIH